MKIIIPIIVVALMIAMGCHHPESSVGELRTEMSIGSTETVIDGGDSFEDVLNGLDASLEYFYYDITQDGEPELWVKAGTCETDMTSTPSRAPSSG